jgi:hypothetical protein
MNKVELELQAKELSSSLQAMEVEQTRLKNQLVSTTERLASINKPIITEEVREKIREAVDRALGNFDFNETRNFDYEFGIDYNNQLTLDNLDFGDTDDLSDTICENVEFLFNVVDVNDITDTSN